MTFIPLLLSMLLADLPAVEAESLKGDVQKGQLQALTAEGATLKSGEEQKLIPAEGLLELRLTAVPANVAAQPTIVVTLLDGSRLSCTAYSVASGEARLTSPNGELSVPIGQVAHVRFTLQTEIQAEAWRGMIDKAGRNDSVVIVTKEGTLDRLSGVVGNVAEKVQFLLDGDELQVNRDKLHGIIYRKREPAKAGSALIVQLVGDDLVLAKSAQFDGTAFDVALAAGGQMKVPADRLRSIDYSAGKVRYLSQDAPREIDATHVWGGAKVEPKNMNNYFRRDRCRSGPLSLNDTIYRRGLYLFPDTTIRYRIGGEFTRFKAVVGIDDEAADGIGDAHLKISDGEGKVLHESDIKNGDPARDLELDVTGVRDLVISVTHGRDKLDCGDFVDLADARVLK